MNIDPKQVPSKETTMAAFAGPAFAVTNFMIHPLAPTVLRLTFVEAASDGINPQYRTAVILTPDGAKNLADLLMRYAPQSEPESKTEAEPGV